MANLPKCYALSGCTAPPVPVLLGDSSDVLETHVCALCIPGVRALGFTVTVTCGETLVTPLIDADTRAMANMGISTPRHRWDELTCAPRNWCPCGCKIFARRFGNAVSFKLMHSATYGCPAGQR